jgi:tRNA pseudouridine38-40 synthase
MRIKLTLAYDGTDYCGWAPSKGHNTIHSVLTQAILDATRHQVDIVGASRTDSGAHAQGQVCHFDTELPIPIDKWPKLINRLLPPDIVVLSAEHVGDDFHSRFCAEDRYYRYRIHVGPPDPFKSRFTYQHSHQLRIEEMKQAALLLIGKHDFQAFTQNLDPAIDNTTRTLREVEIRTEGGEVWIDITGTAFLRGMMRRIAGGLLEVGQGHRSFEDFGLLLTPMRRDVPWPVVLPASGLCLMKVRYSNPPRDCRNR